MANHITGTDGNGATSDFEVTFNNRLLTGIAGGGTTLFWYLGTDAQPATNQFDFVSTALHEIAHGLGIYSYARIASNGTGNWDNNGQFPVPGIYDTKIKNGSGTILTNVVNNSTTLASYLKSNDLFWNGYNGYVGNGYASPKIHAPTTFSSGSSLSHLDEGTYDDNNINAALTPNRPNGKSHHNPGPIIRGMLKDIGWDVEYVVGIEDYITMGTNSQSVSQGHILATNATFHDVSPTSFAFVWSRRLELYHQTGTYTLYNKSLHAAYGSTWLDTMPALPTGYQWLRNYDGSIKAKITVSCLDSDSITHHGGRYINYQTAPDKPVMAVNYVIDHKARIDIFAKGADEYEIYYDSVKGQPYTGTYLMPSNSPVELTDSSYIILDGFEFRKFHYLNARGLNSIGAGEYSDSVRFCIYKPNYQISITAQNGTDNYRIRLKALDKDLATNDEGTHFSLRITDEYDNLSVYNGIGPIPNFLLNDIDDVLELKEGTTAVQWVSGRAYVLELRYKLCEISRLEQFNFTASVGTYSSSKDDNPQNVKNLDIQSSQIQLRLNICPNPSTGIYNLVFTEPIDATVYINVLDLTGKNISSGTMIIGASEYALNIGNVPASTYIVKVGDKKGQISKTYRIVKLD